MNTHGTQNLHDSQRRLWLIDKDEVNCLLDAIRSRDGISAEEINNALLEIDPQVAVSFWGPAPLMSIDALNAIAEGRKTTVTEEDIFGHGFHSFDPDKLIQFVVQYNQDNWANDTDLIWAQDVTRLYIANDEQRLEIIDELSYRDDQPPDVSTECLARLEVALPEIIRIKPGIWTDDIGALVADTPELVIELYTRNIATIGANNILLGLKLKDLSERDKHFRRCLKQGLVSFDYDLLSDIIDTINRRASSSKKPMIYCIETTAFFIADDFRREIIIDYCRNQETTKKRA